MAVAVMINTEMDTDMGDNKDEEILHLEILDSVNGWKKMTSTDLEQSQNSGEEWLLS